MGTPGAPNQIVYWRELCKSVLLYVEERNLCRLYVAEELTDLRFQVFGFDRD